MIDIDALPIWTVYDHPKDFPREFVARKSLISNGVTVVTDEVLVSPKLRDLRDEMERRGLYRLPRFDNDDPIIVECWL